MMANLAEFERLDNKRDLLPDDEYFRWVYLHPEWTAETKQRFTNKRRKEIRARETQVQKDISSRLSQLSNVAKGGVSVAKKLAYVKNPLPENQRRASSSKPLVDSSKVTKRRTRGKPPKPTQVQSPVC